MNDVFAKIALGRIEEAINNGEFENLRGKGKPLNLNYLDRVPPEMRMAYTVLRNSGFVPEEISLLREIGELREKLALGEIGDKRESLNKQLIEKQLKYDLLRETLSRNKKINYRT